MQMPPSQPQPDPRGDSHRQRHAQIARAVRATGAITLLSRVGGLARDVIVGRMFGATMVNSAFQFAFGVPNMFRRLFGEGALSAAFVPEYAQVVRDAAQGDRRAADQLASLTLFALALVTGALTVLVELALLAVLVFSTPNPERALTLKLLMVMMPFMPLICCAAVLSGMLQVHARYAAAASGPLLLNAFIIITGAYFIFTGSLASEIAAYAIGAATVLSGLTQSWWFARLLRPCVSWTRAFDLAKSRAKVMFKRFVPVAIGLGTLQLNTLIDGLIATAPLLIGPTILGYTYPLDNSSNAILALTARFYQFPLGVFGIAVASAIFPLLSRHADEPDHFLDTLRRAIRLSLLVGLPATLGLILIRTDAIAVLYAHGSTGWSPDDVARSSDVLLAFAIGVWAYGLNHVFTRALYALKDTVSPMRVAIVMVGVNVLLNISLIWSLREAGLAWATSISATLQCLTLFILLRKKLAATTGSHVKIIDLEVRSAILRIGVATALMALAVLVVQWALPAAPFLREIGAWGAQLIRLLIAVLTGGACFTLAAWMLGCQEPRWLLTRPAPNPSAGDSSAMHAQAPIDPGQ